MSLVVRVEKTGRILIPVEIRRKLGLVEGESDVLLDVAENGSLRVATREQILNQIWAIMSSRPPRVSLADELLADRRREAAEEDSN